MVSCACLAATVTIIFMGHSSAKSVEKISQRIATDRMKNGCPRSVSPVSPTSIHALRPGDIRVVAGIGDGFTTGFEARSDQVLDYTDFRGVSWSTGGDDDIRQVLSLPNMLRATGSSAIGKSVGSNPTGLPPSPGSDSGFNVGQSLEGTTARAVNQATSLAIDLRDSKLVNFTEDWKVITIWLGMSDLCKLCDSDPEKAPENVTIFLERMLDTLKSKVPRAYVNLVGPFDVTDYSRVTAAWCGLWLGQNCACGTSSDVSTRERVSEAAAKLAQLLDALARLPKYHDQDDFTVEMQPLFTEAVLPRAGRDPDTSYLSPDCFHWSKSGHEMAAVGLWNNMFQRIDEKTRNVSPDDFLLCPTERRPYICTLTNNCGAM